MSDRYCTTAKNPSVRHLLIDQRDYLNRLCTKGHPFFDTPTTRTDLPVCKSCLAKLNRMNRQAKESTR